MSDMTPTNSNPHDHRGADGREPLLSPDDQRIVDALLELGDQPRSIPIHGEGDRRRTDAASGLLGLLKDYPVEDADGSLIHATLARIDRIEDEAAERRSFQNQQQAAERGRRIRIPDFLTVAAVLLIAVSIFWPVTNAIRRQSLDAACANNLRHMGYAFSQYAGDNGGSLPVAMAGPMAAWDKMKNVLNLEPLVSGQYCELSHLNCPGHHGHAHGPSYSYRMISPGTPTNWGVTRVTVVLGDLNPIVEAARSGLFLAPLSVSTNHGGRGQNVLCSDGATLWLDLPVIGGADNIWLPRGFDRLESGLRPSDESDVFLTH